MTSTPCSFLPSKVTAPLTAHMPQTVCFQLETKYGRHSHHPPILLYTVAGSCPDIRRASTKKRKRKERVNKVGLGGGVERCWCYWWRLLAARDGTWPLLFRVGGGAAGRAVSVKRCEPLGGRRSEVRGRPTGQLKREREKIPKMLALRTFVLLGLSWTCRGESDPPHFHLKGCFRSVFGVRRCGI